MKQRKNAEREKWDAYYRKRTIPWQSNGLSSVTARFLKKYAEGTSLLEIGCGTGEETQNLISAGFEYRGFDISREGIRLAKKNNPTYRRMFFVGDFFKLSTSRKYSVLYDKGVFHNSAGVRPRERFVRQAASLLTAGGIWVSVCGSADAYDSKVPHGAVFLQHIVAAVEPYFEIVEVVKASYGTKRATFDGWYCVFRRR